MPLSTTCPSSPQTTPDCVPQFITVVIPVRNEERFIGRVLDSLLAQQFPADSFEVLVVDGGSEDRTRDIVREYALRSDNVRLLENPRRLSSAARNIGAQHARGEFVIIVDGHCQLTDANYLANVVAAFSRTGADCLGRPQPLDVSHATPMQRAIAAARSCWLGHHPDSLIYSREGQFAPAASVAVAYRRDVFERVGDFDERFDACEDYEFNVRCDQAGLRCYFEPNIAVHYHPRSSLPGLLRQMMRYGRGRVRLASKHPHTISWKSFLPAAFLLGLVVGPLVSWCWPPLTAVYVAIVMLYCTIVIGVSALLAYRQRSLGLFFRLPLVFTTVHVGSGLGVWQELLFGLPRFRRLHPPSGRGAVECPPQTTKNSAPAW